MSWQKRDRKGCRPKRTVVLEDDGFLKGLKENESVDLFTALCIRSMNTSPEVLNSGPFADLLDAGSGKVLSGRCASSQSKTMPKTVIALSSSRPKG